MKGFKYLSMLCLTVFLGLSFVNVIHAQEAKNAKGETGKTIIKKSEDLPQPDSAISKMTMKIYLKAGKIEEKEFEVYSRRNISSGVDGALMSFTKPSKIKLLTNSKKNGEDQQWIKMSSGKPKKTADIGKEKSFVGSNFNYEDMSPRKLDDYDYKFLREEKVTLSDGKNTAVDCYVVEAIKKVGEIIYEKAVIYVKKSDYFPARVNLYQKGQLAKVLENYDVKTIKGIVTPLKVVMYKVDGDEKTPLNKIEIKTEIIVNEGYPQYNVPENKVKLEYFKSEAM